MIKYIHSFIILHSYLATCTQFPSENTDTSLSEGSSDLPIIAGVVAALVIALIVTAVIVVIVALSWRRKRGKLFQKSGTTNPIYGQGSE